MYTKIPHSSSTLSLEDFKHIKSVLDNNFIGKGKIVGFLQDELSSYTGKRHSKLVNNGTNALFLALKVLMQKFPNRNQVITSAYICPSVYHAIKNAGLFPVFADVKYNELNISLEAALEKVSQNTLCFLIPHTGGIPVDIQHLRQNTSLPIIDDCAQAIGATINDKLIGEESDFLIYSFGSTKFLTGGIGGAILTNNQEYNSAIDCLTDYEGPESKYESGIISPAYNMDIPDLNAGVILSQLNRLNDLIEARKLIADIYDSHFSNHPLFQIVQEKSNVIYNRYRYYFFSDYSKKIIQTLQDNNIDARSSIAHNFSSYFNLDLKNLEVLTNKTVSLPIYPNLTQQQARQIVKIIKNIYG